jgi:hypothetical protein
MTMPTDLKGREMAAHERIEALGATTLLRDLQADKARWTTFADIEGNEFDLIAG